MNKQLNAAGVCRGLARPGGPRERSMRDSRQSERHSRRDERAEAVQGHVSLAQRISFHLSVQTVPAQGGGRNACDAFIIYEGALATQFSHFHSYRRVLCRRLCPRLRARPRGRLPYLTRWERLQRPAVCLDLFPMLHLNRSFSSHQLLLGSLHWTTSVTAGTGGIKSLL